MADGFSISPVSAPLVRLCAARGASAAASEMLLDAQLQRFPAQVVEFPDVYRTLAWLCTRKPDGRFEHTPRAVLVCVDQLAPEEFEFFGLMAHLRPGLTVLVYGQDRSPAITRALQGGAGALLTPAALEALRVEEPTPAADAAPPAEPPTDAPDSPVTATLVGDEEEEDEELLDEPSEEEEEFEEPSPTRVPWRTYNDRPQRIAPSRRPDGNGADARPTIQGKATGRSSAPLLSEEELRALIGDDVSSLAPPGPGISEYGPRGIGEGNPHDPQRRG